MGLKSFCSRDPLLDFIHETFGATVIRLPDPRWQPLSVFRCGRDRIRYLGLMGELAPVTAPSVPPVESVNLPIVEYEQSAFMEWQLAADLLGPILAHLVGLGLGDVTGSFEAARKKSTKVALSLARTKRNFVHPVAVARWIDQAKPALPSSMIADLASDSIYIVDSVILARKINILVQGDASTEVTSRLGVALGPKLNANDVVTTSNRVSIVVPRAAPFALTAIEVMLDGEGLLQHVRTERGPIRAAAASVELLSPMNRPVFAGAHETVDFDD